MSYWSNGIATLHHSDAREMPIESNSVHCVVTSPPYYGLRKYRADEELVIGDESTPEKYVESIVAVFNEVYRVLRDDGMAWLNLGDSYSVNGTLLGIPWRVAFALQDHGWTLRSDVIWAKKSCMPESMAGTRYQDGVLRQGSWRSTSSHEHIFQLTKGMNYYSDGESVKTPVSSVSIKRVKYGLNTNNRPSKQDIHEDSMGSKWLPHNGANRRDVWRDISPEPYAGEHFATFPPDLPRLCIQASTSEAGVCGSCGNQWARVVDLDRWKPTCDCNADKIPATVLDPFTGTGTTLLAAQRLGRSGIGVDLSEDYLNQAVKRLSKETLPMVLI